MCSILSINGIVNWSVNIYLKLEHKCKTKCRAKRKNSFANIFDEKWQKTSKSNRGKISTRQFFFNVKFVFFCYIFSSFFAIRTSESSFCCMKQQWQARVLNKCNQNHTVGPGRIERFWREKEYERLITTLGFLMFFVMSINEKWISLHFQISDEMKSFKFVNYRNESWVENHKNGFENKIEK